MSILLLIGLAITAASGVLAASVFVLREWGRRSDAGLLRKLDSIDPWPVPPAEPISHVKPIVERTEVEAFEQAIAIWHTFSDNEKFEAIEAWSVKSIGRYVSQVAYMPGDNAYEVLAVFEDKLSWGKDD